MRLADSEEVMAALASYSPDMNGVWPHEWLRRLEPHDLLGELVLAICKRRHLKEYKPLVQLLEACIEAEQGEISRIEGYF